MSFGVEFSLSAITNRYDLSEADFKDLRYKVMGIAVDGMFNAIRDIFTVVFLALYDHDCKTLEIDLSKIVFLKSTVELSVEERRHVLSFLTGYILKYDENNLVYDILKQLSKFNTEGSIPEDFLNGRIFFPSVR